MQLDQILEDTSRTKTKDSHFKNRPNLNSVSVAGSYAVKPLQESSR